MYTLVVIRDGKRYESAEYRDFVKVCEDMDKLEDAAIREGVQVEIHIWDVDEKEFVH
jgi:hypothetical protein